MLQKTIIHNKDGSVKHTDVSAVDDSQNPWVVMFDEPIVVKSGELLSFEYILDNTERTEKGATIKD